MLKTIRQTLKRQEGATAVEYGLMVALIAVVIIVAVVALGKQSCNAFSATEQSVANKTVKTGTCT